MVEVRMASVVAYPKGTPPKDRDVVGLRGICDAGTTFGERILVGELRHVRGGSVDVVQVLVLHQDDDELIEVACGQLSHRFFRRESRRPREVTGERACADERGNEEENR